MLNRMAFLNNIENQYLCASVFLCKIVEDMYRFSAVDSKAANSTDDRNNRCGIHTSNEFPSRSRIYVEMRPFVAVARSHTTSQDGCAIVNQAADRANTNTY